MSMSKHTPGPWLQKSASITSANGWPIAFASYTERMPDTNEEREPGESWLDASNRLKTERDRIESKMEANARLIAAAPELLEALGTLLNRLEGIGGEHVTGMEGVDADLMKANAAIAKATGVEQ